MPITNYEYQQLYILDGENGVEVIPKSRMGDVLDLTQYAIEKNGSAKLEIVDLDNGQMDELMEALSIGMSSLYPVVHDEEEDQLCFDGWDFGESPLENIEYQEGWFGTVSLGPFDSSEEALEEADRLAIEWNEVEEVEDEDEDEDAPKEEWWDEGGADEEVPEEVDDEESVDESADLDELDSDSTEEDEEIIEEKVSTNHSS